MAKSKNGILYVVGTPIGNLEDITLRAIRVLKEVDLILCEDTRNTGILLSHYKIKNKLLSYHAKSALKKTDEIILMLKDGKEIALVSDAGTPGISDPGSLLISKVLQLGTSCIQVVAVPGTSALTAALSVSGFMGGSFVFHGFIPHKKGRETLFKKMAEIKETQVFYESSHRIMKTLESLNKAMPERKMMIAREMTKIFEENLIGTPSEILEILSKNPKKQKGEFVMIIYS